MDRLATLASMVPAGSRVADVGSGHGLLARELLLDRRAARCIATELTAARAELIRVLPADHPRAADAETRWGDGLEPLRPDDRLDVLVLAGMGARSICRILSDPRRGTLGLRRILLQPQTEPALLRRWLRTHGVGLVDERLIVERGRVYLLLAAEPGAASPGHPALAPEELDQVGPCLLAARDPLLASQWQTTLARLSAVPPHASGPAAELARQEVDLARRVVRLLQPLV